MTETVNRLLAPQQYTEGRPGVFPSESSFEWFVRQHRAELVSAGALVRPTGRWLVQPEAFDQVVLKIGQRRAVA